MITIYDSFLQEAIHDLQAAKVLVKERLYSQTLYHIEQSLEKSSKSLYSYYAIIHDYASEKEIYRTVKGFSHDNSKMIPEIYCKICDIEEKYIYKLPDNLPEVAKLKTQLEETVSGLRLSVHKLKDKIKNRSCVDEKALIDNYPSEVDKEASSTRSIVYLILSTRRVLSHLTLR